MTDISIEDLIFSNLVHNEDYIRTTLPYIKPEYFVNHEYRIVFGLIEEHFTKYNVAPTQAALKIELDDLQLNQDSYAEAVQLRSIAKTRY